MRQEEEEDEKDADERALKRLKAVELEEEEEETGPRVLCARCHSLRHYGCAASRSAPSLPLHVVTPD